MHIISTNFAKRSFGNMNMTSNCDVTNSVHQIQTTNMCHWMKPPSHNNFLRTPLVGTRFSLILGTRIGSVELFSKLHLALSNDVNLIFARGNKTSAALPWNAAIGIFQEATILQSPYLPKPVLHRNTITCFCVELLLPGCHMNAIVQSFLQIQ